MWLFKLALIVAVVYIAVVAMMYATQTGMLFPTRLATASGPRLPASAAWLEVETPDGERLRGVHVPRARDRAGERLVVLGFGGNAWNADTVAVYLHELFPDVDVFCSPMRRSSMITSLRPLAWRVSLPWGSASAPASRRISRRAVRLPV